jgi:hypothetical protein
MGTPNVQCTSKLPTAHEPVSPRSTASPAAGHSAPQAKGQALTVGAGSNRPR